MIDYIIKGCQIGFTAFTVVAVFITLWLFVFALISVIAIAIDKLKGIDE